MIDLSVIVPVYNVEKYLNRCLESILQVNNSRIEIILVDDRSKDFSGNICDFFGSKYSFVKVVHKTNEGLGFARNIGIEEATGKYLMFVDSDDFIKSSLVELLLDKVISANLDVCCFGRSFFRNGILSMGNEIFPNETVNSMLLAERCLGEPLKNDKFQVGPAWKAIYKKQFLFENNLRFESERDILSEDYVFSTQLFAAKPRVGFFDRDIYVYCDNQGSLTNSYNPDRTVRAIKLYRRMLDIIENAGFNKSAEFRAYNNFLINLLVVFKHISLNDGLKAIGKIREIKSVINDSEIIEIVKSQKNTDTLQLKFLRELILAKKSKCIYFAVKLRYKR